MNTCMHAHTMHKCTHMYTYTYTHTRTHICTPTCTYIHMSINTVYTLS